MTGLRILPRARLGAVVVAALIVCACATSRGGTEGGLLAGTEWRLVELNSHPAVGAAARRPWLRLNTDSGRVEGSGGCNRLSGSMTRNGSSLTFGPLLTTKMACVDAAVNSQEQEFLAALHATERYETVADTLTLLRGTDRVARLVR